MALYAIDINIIKENGGKTWKIALSLSGPQHLSKVGIPAGLFCACHLSLLCFELKEMFDEIGQTGADFFIATQPFFVVPRIEIIIQYLNHAPF